MTAKLKLPRMLAQSVKRGLDHELAGSTVGELLDQLFRREPGVRVHLVDEQGEIRPHVSIFVDGNQATADTPVEDGADVRVLHAVSGGAVRG